MTFAEARAGLSYGLARTMPEPRRPRASSKRVPKKMRTGPSRSPANIAGDELRGRKRRAVLDDKEVAAFPGPRLRHFQKQGSVEEQLKARRSPVQVELKLRSLQPSE